MSRRKGKKSWWRWWWWRDSTSRRDRKKAKNKKEKKKKKKKKEEGEAIIQHTQGEGEGDATLQQKIGRKRRTRKSDNTTTKMASPAFPLFFEVFSYGVVMTVAAITTVAFAERCWKCSAPLNSTGLCASIVSLFYSTYGEHSQPQNSSIYV